MDPISKAYAAFYPATGQSVLGSLLEIRAELSSASAKLSLENKDEAAKLHLIFQVDDNIRTMQIAASRVGELLQQIKFPAV